MSADSYQSEYGAELRQLLSKMKVAKLGPTIDVERVLGLLEGDDWTMLVKGLTILESLIDERLTDALKSSDEERRAVPMALRPKMRRAIELRILTSAQRDALAILADIRNSIVHRYRHLFDFKVDAYLPTHPSESARFQNSVLALTPAMALITSDGANMAGLTIVVLFATLAMEQPQP